MYDEGPRQETGSKSRPGPATSSGRIIYNRVCGTAEPPRILSAWTARFPAGASADLLTLSWFGDLSLAYCLANRRGGGGDSLRRAAQTARSNGSQVKFAERFHRPRSFGPSRPRGPVPRQRNTPHWQPRRLVGRNNSRPAGYSNRRRPAAWKGGHLRLNASACLTHASPSPAAPAQSCGPRGDLRRDRGRRANAPTSGGLRLERTFGAFAIRRRRASGFDRLI